jgi:hypothetical protein
MTTKTNKRRDFTQVALAVVQQATGEIEPTPELTGKKADSRKGGLKGGKARTEKLTPEERSEIAKKGALVRWNNPTHKENDSSQESDSPESIQTESHS